MINNYVLVLKLIRKIPVIIKKIQYFLHYYLP